MHAMQHKFIMILHMQVAVMAIWHYPAGIYPFTFVELLRNNFKTLIPIGFIMWKLDSP